MDALEIWKLVNLGLLVDWEKRTATVRLGPITLERVPLPRLRAIAADQELLQRIVSELFVKRRVMWKDLRLETPQFCRESLEGMAKDARAFVEQLKPSRKSQDRELAEILAAWENAATLAAKDVAMAVEMENDPADSGMDTSARDGVDDAIVQFRSRSYPSADFMIGLLRESPVRDQARAKFDEGVNVLVAAYHRPAAMIERAEVTLL